MIRKLYYKVIRSSKWRRIRAFWLKKHPCCEICGRDEKTTIIDVHHRTPLQTVEEIEGIQYGQPSDSMPTMPFKSAHGEKAQVRNKEEPEASVKA